MGKALYRTYRSKTLDELVGQDHISTALKNAIETDSIAHAYLFTGPRGVGKTSVARIFAHAINKLPYTPEDSPVDIIEIDGASNGRVDEARELREKSYIAPVSAKYKVYIIDEVHMLSIGAFNALLKILEEPPSHVIFILATTEIGKLPDTIISRCLHFTFRSIPDKDIVNHLSAIAKQENLKIDKSALELIAKHGKGSFRDSISLLDQMKHTGQTITLQDVERLLGRVSADSIGQLVDLLEKGNTEQVLGILDELYTQGGTPESVASQLIDVVRGQVVSNTSTIPSSVVFGLLRALIAVPASRNPRLELELSLLEAMPAEDRSVLNSGTDPLPVSTPAPESKKTKTATAKVDRPEDIVSGPVVTIASESSVKASDTDFWQAILDSLKEVNRTLYGIARMAKVDKTDDTLTIEFSFAFHQRQMNENKNKQLLQDIIAQQDASIINIQIIHKATKKDFAPEKKDDTLNSITNIFGPSEVLES